MNRYLIYSHRASQLAQWSRICLLKQETQETWVQILGQGDPLEKEMAAYSSTIAWKIPWMEESTVHGVTKSRTQLSNSTFFLYLFNSPIPPISPKKSPA